MKGRMVKGRNYLLNFTDQRQAPYTWYSGTGIFLRLYKEKFPGENEVLYVFCLPDGEKCTFPKSSVIQEIRT